MLRPCPHQIWIPLALGFFHVPRVTACSERSECLPYESACGFKNSYYLRSVLFPNLNYPAFLFLFISTIVSLFFIPPRLADIAPTF